MTNYAKATSRPVQKMADGGSVGFFERLRAGNIDDPSSEAYKRWGAGSKAAAPAPSPAPEPAPAPAPAPEVPDASPREAIAQNDADEKADRPVDREFTSKSPASAPKPRTNSILRKAAPRASQSFPSGLAAGTARGAEAARKSTNEKQKVLSTAGLDPKTLLPIKTLANGGQVGNGGAKSYGKK